MKESLKPSNKLGKFFIEDLNLIGINYAEGYGGAFTKVEYKNNEDLYYFFGTEAGEGFYDKWNEKEVIKKIVDLRLGCFNNRVKNGEEFYYITKQKEVFSCPDDREEFENKLFDAGNYFINYHKALELIEYDFSFKPYINND